MADVVETAHVSARVAKADLDVLAANAEKYDRSISAEIRRMVRERAAELRKAA